MSRIGKQPIPVPAGVTIAIEPDRVTVNGPKGELSERIQRAMKVEQTPRGDGADGDQILVTRPSDRGDHRALHGLTRTLIANMVTGVTDGFSKTLEIQGVGYRAQLRGDAAVGAENRDPRTLGAAAHLGAHATPALEPAGWSSLDGHARLPTFRATYSPS